jgi:hypothetical protein
MFEQMHAIIPAGESGTARTEHFEVGIGLILVPLFARENVKSITVIERNQDVIDLISSHLQSDKLQIICADIFDWKPTKGRKFDVIYFDIWPDVCEDNLDQMSKLHNRFKFNLNRENPDAFMDSWKREELKYQRQRSKSYRYGW